MPLFSKPISKDMIIDRSSQSSNSLSPIVTGADAVHVVTSKDYKAAAACLANAFSKDDVAAYFYNCQDTVGWSDERKWKLHLQLMEAITYAHVKFGLVHAMGDLRINDSYDAVTLWMPPGANMDGYFSLLKSGVLWKGLGVVWQLSKEGRTRLLKEFFPLLTATKAEVLQERDPSSWYLVYIGTHARARGKGLARKILASVFRQADTDRQAIYLESSNIVNVAIYRKMGFEVCKQICLKRSTENVLLDIMVREPMASNINGRGSHAVVESTGQNAVVTT